MGWDSPTPPLLFLVSCPDVILSEVMSSGIDGHRRSSRRDSRAVPAGRKACPASSSWMFFAIFFFALVFGLALLASLFKGKNGERVQGALFGSVSRGPLAIGLMYPAILTINQALRGRSGVGGLTLSNYFMMFTQPEPAARCATRPCGSSSSLGILATSIGLIYAILIDRARARPSPRP